MDNNKELNKELEEYRNRIKEYKKELETTEISALIPFLKDSIKHCEEMISVILKYENKKKEIGRPSLGVTKKVSLTLPEELWNELDRQQDLKDISSRSALLRQVIESYLEQT